MIINNEFSLYIHLPWCYKKCPYCDFNAYDLNTHKPDFDLYFKQLKFELYRIKNHYPHKTDITTIYFGGGTPSLAPPKLIDELMILISDIFTLPAQTEVTMEVSPRDSIGNIEDFVKCGINRFSVGIQSFDDKILQSLGREHTADMILPIINKITSLDVRCNIDIIYGLEEQSHNMALGDLKKAINTGVEHLSWYELTLEANTLFAKKGKKKLPPETIEDIFFQGQTLLAEAGYKHYEISAYSKNKPSMHNINYWLFNDYIGIGAGAHSKITSSSMTIHREYRTRYPKDYMRFPLIKTDKFCDHNLDYLICRLRLFQSIKWSEIQDKLPPSNSHHLIQWLKQLSLKLPQICRTTCDKFSLTEKGKYLITDIIEQYCQESH